MLQQTLVGCAFCDVPPGTETGEAHIWRQDERVTHPICIDCAIQMRPNLHERDPHVQRPRSRCSRDLRSLFTIAVLAHPVRSGGLGVDEELRKVPFLETRAAAKEIDATVEFRKTEGVDSIEDATAGDHVYLGISELNDGMSDAEGDPRMQRVDGGGVYRAELNEDYNISTLEPVGGGADASDPPQVIDDAPINIDNVLVLEDCRVLLCGDASQYNRTHPKDGLCVYEPYDDRDCGHGNENGEEPQSPERNRK